ncbi:MAG: glycoside hydrolase family 13 protein [Micropruina sp.]
MTAESEWWRQAVVYQIYPRSFADGNGDGEGDIRGMIEKLPYLEQLGVDAVWVSPWYPSPMADGGYDVSDYRDIDPRFGTLADADEFIADAHARGLRVIIDLVPNHSSDQHPWFQAALTAPPGSLDRARYHFRDGRGEDGNLPPNNWPSLFGGSAWERVTEPDGKPGQWYLHMFAPEQPDWNWDNPEVVEEFDSILRFWFDRGIDGLRVDVADALVKDRDLPDTPQEHDSEYGTWKRFEGSPFWDQPGVLLIQQRWRVIADSYADSPQGARVFCSEANADPLEKLVRYVGPGQLHSTFNFDHLHSEWTASSLRHMIDRSITAHQAVSAPTTWVLGNHDSARVASRYGKPITGRVYTTLGASEETKHWGAEDLERQPTDVALGRRRARAAALLELALPGGAYIYQGEELGLNEVEDLPAAVMQDPSFFRNHGKIRGRDGCRVPLPWSGTEPPFGFGADTWLPQPADWAQITAEAQDGDPSSTLNVYRAALALRRTLPALGEGRLLWDESWGPDVLCFDREPGVSCLVNFGADPVALPAGTRVLVASGELVGESVPSDVAVWLAR